MGGRTPLDWRSLWAPVNRREMTGPRWREDSSSATPSPCLHPFPVVSRCLIKQCHSPGKSWSGRRSWDAAPGSEALSDSTPWCPCLYATRFFQTTAFVGDRHGCRHWSSMVSQNNYWVLVPKYSSLVHSFRTKVALTHLPSAPLLWSPSILCIHHSLCLHSFENLL
jgi:hypothetical protein